MSFGLNRLLPDAEANREFVTGWRSLLGTTAAISTSLSLFILVANYFVTSIEAETGWTREQISFGTTLVMVTNAVLFPLIGTLTDRYSPRVVGSIGLVGYALSCGLVAITPARLELYYASMGFVALFTTAASAVVFAPIVADAFDRRRGIAFGITFSGGAILLIPLAPVFTWLVSAQGWRAGYIALGLGALCVGLPGLLLATTARIKRHAARPVHTEGATLIEALRLSAYWKIVGGTIACALPIGGVLHHLSPIFADKGLEVGEVGVLASVFVTTVVAGRVVVGLMLDLLNAPLVALGVMLLAMCGAALMAGSGPSLAIACLSVALIGCAMGAEGDIHGFFIARHFGLKHFSSIFSTTSMCTSASLGLGALVFGALFDRSGSYQIALTSAAVSLLVGGLLFASLPQKKRPVFSAETAANVEA